jgi:hypothetical protein
MIPQQIIQKVVDNMNNLISETEQAIKLIRLREDMSGLALLEKHLDNLQLNKEDMIHSSKDPQLSALDFVKDVEKILTYGIDPKATELVKEILHPPRHP